MYNYISNRPTTSAVFSTFPYAAPPHPFTLLFVVTLSSTPDLTIFFSVGKLLAILICSRYFCFCAARFPLASNSSAVGGGGGAPNPFLTTVVCEDELIGCVVMSLLSLMDPYCRVLNMDGFLRVGQNDVNIAVVVDVGLDVVRPVVVAVDGKFVEKNPRRPVTVTYASVMMRPRKRKRKI